MSSNQKNNTILPLKRRVRKRCIENQPLSQPDNKNVTSFYYPDDSSPLKICVRKRRIKKQPSLQLNYKKVKNEESQPEDDEANDAQQVEHQKQATGEKKDDLNLECDEHFEDLEETLGNFKEKIPSLPPMFHCVECFFYMGEMNPRQNCRKVRCDYDFLNEKEMLQTRVFHLRSSPYYNDSTFYGYPSYHNTIQKFIDDNYIEDTNEK